MKKVYGDKDVELRGWWQVELKDQSGKLLQRREGRNVVVDNGKEFMASFLNSAVAAARPSTDSSVATAPRRQRAKT